MLEADLKCESKHNVSHNLVCSVSATHRFVDCTKRLLVCDEFAAAFERYFEQARRGSCSACGEPAATHWKVYPL